MFIYDFCSCSTDQGGLLALSDGPCADPSSILVDLVRFLFVFRGSSMCYDLITVVVKSLFVCNCYIQGLSENHHVVREHTV